MSTINLTLEQANTLLAQIGVAAVVVADAEQATPDANTDELAGSVTKGDPVQGFTQEEVNKKVDAAVGKLFGTIRTALGTAFGVKTTELEGLEAKELAAKLKEVSQSRYVAQNTELAGQIEELTRQLNAKEEEFTGRLSNVERDWESRLSERDILDYTSGVFDKIPKRGGNSRVQAETAVGKWKNLYDVRFDPAAREVRFYVKGTDDMVMDGKNPLKADKLGKDFFTEMGLDVSDTSHLNPKDVINDQGNGNGGTFQQPGMGVPGANVPENFAGLVADVTKGA